MLRLARDAVATRQQGANLGMCSEDSTAHGRTTDLTAPHSTDPDPCYARRVPQHGSGSALHHATARGPMLPHAAAAGPGGAGDEQLREEDSAVYEQLQQEVDAMKHKDIQQA